MYFVFRTDENGSSDFQGAIALEGLAVRAVHELVSAGARAAWLKRRGPDGTYVETYRLASGDGEGARASATALRAGARPANAAEFVDAARRPGPPRHRTVIFAK